MTRTTYFTVEGRMRHPAESPTPGKLSGWMTLDKCRKIRSEELARRKLACSIRDYGLHSARLVRITRDVLHTVKRRRKGVDRG